MPVNSARDVCHLAKPAIFFGEAENETAEMLSAQGKAREVDGKTAEIEARNTGVLCKIRAVFGEIPATMRQAAVSSPRDAGLYGRASWLLPWTSKTSGKASPTLPNERANLGMDARADTNEQADSGKKLAVLPKKISLSGSAMSLASVAGNMEACRRVKPTEPPTASPSPQILLACDGTLLPSDDAGQRAQRTIHGFGIGKCLRHVRLQHHNICALRVTARIPATHSAGEIIFRLHFRFGCFARCFLHGSLVLFGWRVAR